MSEFGTLQHTSKGQETWAMIEKEKGKKEKTAINASHTTESRECAYGGGGWSLPTLSQRQASYPPLLGLASCQEPPWNSVASR
jgi:hypothetical protein